MSYDEQLLLSIVRKAATAAGRTYITYPDVEEAFWRVSSDLRLALKQQAPDKLEEAEEMFREEMLPGLVATLRLAGLNVQPA